MGMTKNVLVCGLVVGFFIVGCGQNQESPKYAGEGDSEIEKGNKMMQLAEAEARAAENIPAILPESSAAWITTQTSYEYPLPSPGSWEENTNTGRMVKVGGVWHIIYNSNNDVDNPCSGTVGRKLGVATSPTGLGNWTKAKGNPVIEYVGHVRDCDYGISGAVLGRNPDGSLAKVDGKWVLIFGNYDGVDSTLGWATSVDGVTWTERGKTGIKKGSPGSGDRGEAWPDSLVRDTDGTWYAFYHGGGESGRGGGRTWGVAYGSTPKQLVPYAGNPVLRGTEEWEGYTIFGTSNILKDATGWVVAYQGKRGRSGAIGIARSDDLKTWVKKGQILDNMTPKIRGSLLGIDNGNGSLTWRLYISGGVIAESTVSIIVEDTTPTGTP